MKYIYFVSYAFQDEKGTGFAYGQAARDKTIKTLEEINDVTESLKAKFKHQGVTIMNYKLLRIETD